MEQKSILITGGAGFIGSNLSKFLIEQGHYVMVIDNLSNGFLENIEPLLDHHRFKFVQIDICDPNLKEVLSKEKVHVVFHLAGISALAENQSKPIEALDNNVIGTVNLLEACRYIYGLEKFVFASTSAVYENEETHPTKEYCHPNPDLIYSQSKLFGESLVRSYYRNYKIPTVILRYFNIYGPRQNKKRKSPPFTSYMISNLLRGRAVTFYGKGNVERDYVYIDDLNDLHLRIINCDPSLTTGGIFNVCSGKGYTAAELFQTMRSLITTEKVQLTRSKSTDFWKKYDELFNAGVYNFSEDRVVKELNKYSIGSPNLTYKTFGWAAKIPIKEGLSYIVIDEAKALKDEK